MEEVGLYLTIFSTPTRSNKISIQVIKLAFQCIYMFEMEEFT